MQDGDDEGKITRIRINVCDILNVSKGEYLFIH